MTRRGGAIFKQFSTDIKNRLKIRLKINCAIILAFDMQEIHRLSGDLATSVINSDSLILLTTFISI